MKIVRKILIILSWIIIILIATAIAFTYYYEDNITSYIQQEINKNIRTEISAKKIRFSMFKKFPYAAVEFTDIYARSTENFNDKDFDFSTADTIFLFHKLYLEMSVIDILNKRYRIKNIHASNGFTNILTDNEGNTNYKFWRQKKDKKAESKKSFNMQLKNVKLTNVNIISDNRTKKTFFVINADPLRFKGDFSSERFLLSVSSEANIKQFMIDGLSYIRSKEVELNSLLFVKKKKIVIKKGEVIALGQHLKLSGHFIQGDPSEIDIVLYGKELDISSVLKLIPDVTSKKLNKYKTSGSMFLTAKISGKTGTYYSPHVAASFGIENGKIVRKNNQVSLKNINIKALFSNGKKNHPSSSVINISNGSADMGNSHFSFKGLIKNFKQPTLSLKTKTSIFTGEIYDFFKPNTIEYINGQIDSEFSISCKLKKLRKINKRDINELLCNGVFHFRDVNFNLKGSKIPFSKINGTIKVKEKNLAFDTLSLYASHNDLTIKGAIDDAASWILGRSERFSLQADIESKDMDINKFYADTNNPSNKGFYLPENVNLFLNVNLKKFHWGNFTSTNTKTKISYSPGQLMINSLSLNAMKGKIRGNGLFKQQNKEQYKLQTALSLDKININHLFRSFNNFGQKTLQEKHIKGTLSGKLNFHANLDTLLKINTDSVTAKSDVIIQNGELINFKPMLELSRFVAVSELEHITFSTLKNKILIKDEKIIIPEMDIKSSAIDITGYGTHHFNGDYDYHVWVYLSDFLWKKAKKAKRKNSKFGVIADDGIRRRMPLKIIKSGDETKVAYDLRMARDKIKEDINKEVQNFKKALHDEFGLFKKDSAVQALKEQEEKEKRYNISWEEEKNDEKNQTVDSSDNKEIKKEPKKHNKKEQPKLLFEWDDE